MEDDCRIRPLVNLLDSSTGAVVRSDQRVKVGERLIGLLRSPVTENFFFLVYIPVEHSKNIMINQSLVFQFGNSKQNNFLDNCQVSY